MKPLLSTLLAITGAFLFSYAVFAFDPPTATPPGANVPAPINVGADSQDKAGTIRVDGLRVFGSSVFDGNVGIRDTTPDYPLDIVGDIYWSGTLRGGSVPWARLTGVPSFDTTPDTIADDNSISISEAAFTNQNLSTGSSPIFNSLVISNLLRVPGGICAGTFCVDVPSFGGIKGIKSDGGLLVSNGKATFLGGIDPPYISFSNESHESIREYAKDVEGHEKVMQFWNGEAHRIEIYVIAEDEFYTITGELLKE